MQEPSEVRHGTYQVDFESLIKVLGENLYANPKAVVRELIQNASDSCVRRKTKDENFNPTIHISVDRRRHLLFVEDNGAGMLQDEVIRYLVNPPGLFVPISLSVRLRKAQTRCARSSRIVL